MQTHSLSQAATLLGVHRNTLAQWLRDGCPAIEKADRERGVEWQLALPGIIQWRIERAVADAVAPFGGDGDAITREEADRRRAVAVARMAEIDLDEKLRQVVHVADVSDDMADFCQMIRQFGDNAFQKIAVRCASMTIPAQIHAMCQDEWNRSYKIAQTELDQNWGLRLKGGDAGAPGEE